MDSAPKGTGRGTATWPEGQLSGSAEVPAVSSRGLGDPRGAGAGGCGEFSRLDLWGRECAARKG